METDTQNQNPSSEKDVESGGCGCGADEPTEASSQQPTAECVGSGGNLEAAGPAAMMAHCRRMFGGLFGEPDTPAKTEEPPAATAAKGCSGKQEVRR
jgi:hypothetical protein